MGPTCYPIVAETPSGRLRYKTITVGRFSYNVAGVIQNSLTPRMLAENCKPSPLSPLTCPIVCLIQPANL